MTLSLVPPIGDEPPAALDEAVRAIAERYRTRTMDVVAMQLEYTTRVAERRR